MEKKAKTRHGIAFVVLFFLSAIIVISAIESVLFYAKINNIETLEALHNRINHISRVVARLGNTLDIVVVGQRFEQTTINILRNDVDRIDADINKMLNKYTRDSFISANKMLAQELKGMPREWREIYDDMSRFRAEMSSDEVMLVHNDLDVDVLLLDEKLDLISTGITTALQVVFSEIKTLMMVSLAAFVFMLTAAAIFLYLRFIAPMKKLEIAAIAVASGRGQKRFSKNIPGVFGRVAYELNTILAKEEQRVNGLENDIAGLTASVMDKESAINVLGAFFQESGTSFDIETLFGGTLRKVPAMTGACAVFVYKLEGKTLRLKASALMDGNNVTPPALLTVDSIDDGKGISVEIASLGAPAYMAALCSGGAKWFKSFAINSRDSSDYGRLLMLFRDSPDDDKDGFISALASAMGTSITFVERLRDEHDSRDNCFTLINQLPMGIAVFESGGSCVLANLILKRLLGAGPDFDFIRDYRFTDDDLLEAQGLVTTIGKAYDGFVTEFIISYDPRLVRRYGFMGEVRDLRVKSVPLYDPVGNVTKIALIYEDITVTDEPGRGEDSKSI